jgi:hypothetical protein
VNEVSLDTLAVALSWLFSGPGAGIAAYFLMEKIPFLISLSAELKRYVSLFLAAMIAMGAFAIAVSLGYQPLPIGWKGWLEALFAVAGVAIGIGQVIHGRAKLKDRIHTC